jgi:hypothetical protein
VPLRRSLVSALAAVLCAASIAPTFVAAAGPPVRVAIVVGPAGEATDRYRARAELAAREARRFSTDVVTIYSPEATWPRVKTALQGASIVVYLGHGNGWPSRYSSRLNPRTQDGLGLNPAPGGDDFTHQYFGESYLARDIRLAPGAIVLLHHLCYASGNSEPGLPEGTIDIARQRVDNFAAGWLKAGASAVVAEAYIGPSYYVGALLGRRQSIQTAWQRSPSARGHAQAFASVRTPGFTGVLDPIQPSSGFYRSIVIRDDVTNADLLAGARGSVAPPSPAAGPSLAALGVAASAPRVRGTPTAGGSIRLVVPLAIPAGVALPARLGLGVRWDPIVVDPADPDATPESPGVVAPAVDPTAAPDPPAVPGPSAAASPSPGPDVTEPPAVELVAAERPSAVVQVTRASRGVTGLGVDVEAPAVPGLYRLVTTIHDSDGVALDAATQAMVPALVVRVAGQLSAAFGVAPTASAVADRTVAIKVRVANTGTTPWAPPADPDAADTGPRDVGRIPWLVARWLPLDGFEPADGETASLPATIEPGASAVADLRLRAPSRPGPYLLILDVVTPAQGSLAALGSPPALVRVDVAPDPGPASPPPAPRG